MEDFLNQGWFTLQVAWYQMRYELNRHLVLEVILGTIIILLWIFLMPSIRKRGS